MALYKLVFNFNFNWVDDANLVFFINDYKNTDNSNYETRLVTHGRYLSALETRHNKVQHKLPFLLFSLLQVATFKRHLKTLLFTAAYGVTDN